MFKRRKSRPRLRCINGRWYEDGKMLRKKDYVECYSSHEQNYIISFITNQKYRMSDAEYM